MQNEKKSIFVSILLVKILFVCLLAAPFLLPFFIGWYVSLSADLQSVYWPAMIIAYLCLVPAGIAIICMDRLLLNIRKKMVFVKKNADYLYTISWCAYAVCLLFLVMGFWRPLAFVVSFAAFFIGVVLRVVKNVFRQAIAIREENEYTI
ncbi:MAG: DUF2975 domain-containing protein [Oscillospiraceae bacterium]|nr:DUF2975 domain-containing protein [Oscillospiraceae bacterium]MDY3066179.1 DUF2975 domain-containing protein [Oscillospiraceae bacterium]